MLLDIILLGIFYFNFTEQLGLLSVLGAILVAAHFYEIRFYQVKRALAVRVMLWMLVTYELMFRSHYGVASVYGVMLFLHVFVISRESNRTVGHGSSRWAGLTDIVRANLFSKTGLVLGRLQQKWVRYSGEGHVLTCAPTGAGKGTCVVIPNLLVYSGSVFVNDIKGENYQITAQRRREMGQNIIRLDPFAVVDEYTHTMNWMDCLLPDDPNLVAMAQKITDMIIVKDPKSDSHWDNAATALLKGLILHVACYEASRAHSRTMVEVRRLTVLSAKEFKKILYEMQSTEGANGVIKNVANMMLQKSDREFAAVMSTVHHLTDFLDDPRIQKLLGPSTVDWQAIATQPTTVYFIIPPDKLTSYLGLVRSTIVLFMQAASSLSRKVGEERTLFMLDEFSQLGYMQPVEDAISLIRGYGVTLWLLVQDLSQIEAVYPKWKSLLSNVQFFQVFGTNDQFTAEYVSNLLGAATVKAEVTSDKVLPIEMERNLVGDNLVKRALLTPDEVRKMGANGQLIFMQGQYPMFIWKLNYLRDKLLQRFLQDYHVSNKVA